jgi:hypothetical protein
MDAILDRMQARMPSGPTELRPGAQALAKVPVRLEARRRGVERLAFEAEGQNVLSQAAKDGIGTAIDDAFKSISALHKQEIGKDLLARVRRFRGLMAHPERPFVIQDLEDMRQLMADQAKFARVSPQTVSAADVRLSRTIYRIVSEAARHDSRPIEEAMTAGAAMRETAKLLPKGKSVDSLDIYRSYFVGRNAIQRWDDVSPYLTRTELQSARGYYLHEFLSRVVAKDGSRRLVSAEKIAREMRSPGGMFRQELFDRVLPGMRPEIEDLAAISTRVARGIGASRGSPTETRRRVSQLLESPTLVATAAAYLLLGDVSSDQITRVLGAAGAGALGGLVSRSLTRSAVQGRISDQLARSALGQPVIGPTSAVAGVAETTKRALDQLGVTGGTP